MALYTTTNRKLNQILHSSKSGSYTIGLVTVLIVVLMIFLAIMPAYKSITDQIASNDAKTKYLNDLTTKKDTMDRLLKEYEQFSDQIKLFDEYTPIKANNELLVANLDKLARNHNLTMTAGTFDKEILPKTVPYNAITGLMTQPFTVAFRGNLTNLEALLAQLELYPTLLNFKSISYSHGETNTVGATGLTIASDPNFTLTMTGEYYFWNNTKQ